MRRNAGFSLLELLVVVAIISIPLVMYPRFRVEGLELTRLTDDTVHLLQRARFEAIKRNEPTFVKIDKDSGTIKLYVDSNNSGGLDGDDLLLQKITTSDYKAPLVINGSSFAVIRWTPQGLPQKENGALGAGRITLGWQGKPLKKTACISAAGRVRVHNGGSCS